MTTDERPTIVLDVRLADYDKIIDELKDTMANLYRLASLLKDDLTFSEEIRLKASKVVAAWERIS